MKKSIIQWLFAKWVLGYSCTCLANGQYYVEYHPVQNVAQRLQWHQNFGYCGETSFITTGQAVGQYVSQYTMRSLASPKVNQYSPKSQLLIGVNDASTANKVRYKHSEFSNCTIQSKAFLKWIKARLYQGHPVIIGVYLNEYLYPFDIAGEMIF